VSAPRPRDGIRIEIAPRTILYALLAVAAVWLAIELWTVLVVMLVALVLVGTFDPLVAWFETHGWKRGRALILIFFFIALALVAIVLLTIPPLVSQLQHIIDIAPREQRKIANWVGQWPWARSIASAIRGVKLDDMMLRAGNSLLEYSSQLLIGIGYAVTTLFIAIYLLADPRTAKGALFAVVPRQHHVKLARILLELKTMVGGYMRGQLITSVAITIFTFGLLSAFRIDDALALAMFAGLTDVIPFIGGYLASAPAILAVSGQGGVAIAVVAVAMFAYQEFESRILVPRVYGRTLRLSPAVVLVALLIGGTLLGILGALLALPMAAGARLIVRELRVELPGEGGADAEMRKRDEKAEHMYEQLTAGTPVEDAAVIAGELAQRIKETEAAGGTLTGEMPVIMKELGTEAPAPSVAENKPDELKPENLK
jgi:predicted PurR-regulated permease PerM